MGVIDKVIEAVSPRWAASREAWRQGLDSLRNYDAGSNSRLNAGWRVFNESAEATDRWSRDVVRARARDLERNSDVMNSVLGAYKRNVVGLGLQLQPMTRSSRLNSEILALWDEWCTKGNCEVTGTQGFSQLLRMLVVRKKIDGGILVLKRYVDAKVPFMLQILEVDELDGAAVPVSKDARVVGGIEYNQYNRATGYWFRCYQADGMTAAKPMYVPAEDVIFYFTKRRPSQVREMSDMSPTLSRIRDVNEFMTAVSVKQRVMACLSVFIKKSLPPSGLGRSGSSSSLKKDYDGKSLTPGIIKELNEGDDVEVVNPTGQSADATSFAKLQQRMVGAGQGISYEATSRDMSETSYSSARQGLNEDELTFFEEQEQLIQVMDDIYAAFLDACFLAGLLSAAGYWQDKGKYQGHKWVKQPKAWIDPLKEASATASALQYGIKTYKQVAAESGRDWRQQVDDIAEVMEYAASKGLDFKEVLFNGKTQETQKPDPDTGGTEGTTGGGQGQG